MSTVYDTAITFIAWSTIGVEVVWLATIRQRRRTRAIERATLDTVLKIAYLQGYGDGSKNGEPWPERAVIEFRHRDENARLS